MLAPSLARYLYTSFTALRLDLDDYLQTLTATVPHRPHQPRAEPQDIVDPGSQNEIRA
jgi:hypothetical protein